MPIGLLVMNESNKDTDLCLLIVVEDCCRASLTPSLMVFSGRFFTALGFPTVYWTYWASSLEHNVFAT